jgi:3-dehydroquinate dehydratase-2
MARILVMHGPNLNLLGTREPQVYGQTSLVEIDQELQQCALAAGHELETFQSNHEGALVDCIQQRGTQAALLILNAGAYTHTSIAIRDAILAVGVPVIEVHLSNVYRREPFRWQSYLADIGLGRWPALARQPHVGASHVLLAVLGLIRVPEHGKGAGLEIVGVPTLLQELDDLADLLITLGTDKEHIVSLHDNQIRYANRHYEPLQAINNRPSGLGRCVGPL